VKPKDTLLALEAQIPAITSFFGKNISTKKASNWTNYQISAVPRNITIIRNNGEITKSLITPEILLSVLTKATGSALVITSQTTSSIATLYDYSSN
jgi:hypothetical protein